MTDHSDDDRSDDEVVEEFIEQHDLDDESWTEDGEKYRCPECEAVHEEPADTCRVCGCVPR
jgi:acetone carboxylase gamma subunit